jgi:3-hydroxymyristoyl/3-hydroxydecanoyl-(acyl carrier protein) dehydratase
MKFRMVDRIVDFEGKRSIRGVKTVSFEEYELKSALGDEAHLPETLLMEGLFQLGNWLIMLSSDFSQMGLLIRINSADFLDRVRPGQSVAFEATVRSYRSDGILFDGTAHVDSKIIAAGRGCLAAPVALENYYDPDDLRVLFSQIYRPDE